MGRAPTTQSTTVSVNFIGDASGLSAAIAKVDKTLEQLVKQADQTQAVLGRGMGKASEQAARGFQRAGRAANQYTEAQNLAAKSAGRMRANMQNLGFQFQDIIVQYEMGTDAGRIFAQQGSQIAGIFGASGAAIGVAIALIGTFASSMLDLSTATQKFIDEAEGVEKIVEDLDELNQKMGELNSEPLSEFGRAVLGITENRQDQKVDELRTAVEALGASFEDNVILVEQVGSRASRLWDNLVIGLATYSLQWGTATRLQEEYNMSLIEAERLQEKFGNALTEILDTADPTEMLQKWLEFVETLEQDITVSDGLRAQLAGIEEIIIALAENMSDVSEELQRAENFARKVYAESMLAGQEIKKQKDDLAVANGYWRQQAAAIKRAREEATLLAAETRKIVAELSVAAIQQEQLMRQINGGADQARSESQTGEAGENVARLSERLRKQREQEQRERERGGSGGKSEAEKALEDYNDDLERYNKLMIEAADKATLFGGAMEEAFANQLNQGISGFIDLLASGETSFKEFATTFIRNMAKMVLQAAILNALMTSLGGTAGNPQGAVQGIVQAMNGIPNLGSGPIRPHAKGGVVNGPQLFPMTGGTGLMGEAGPEAIMPIGRNSQGQLGVSGPSITINNNAGVDVAIVRSDEELIEIAVERSTQKVQAQFNQSMSNGQGGYARSLEQGYKARRRAV